MIIIYKPFSQSITVLDDNFFMSDNPDNLINRIPSSQIAQIIDP
jgi:hypothetical protein